MSLQKELFLRPTSPFCGDVGLPILIKFVNVLCRYTSRVCSSLRISTLLAFGLLTQLSIDRAFREVLESTARTLGQGARSNHCEDIRATKETSLLELGHLAG